MEQKIIPDDLQAKIAALSETILPDLRKRMSSKPEIKKRPEPKTGE